MCRRNDEGCICSTIEHIKQLQDAANEVGLPNLVPPQITGKTIPFILYDREGKLMKAFGHIGGIEPERCFQTAFFSIEEIRENCCATLTLLKPFHHQCPIDIVTDEDVCELTTLKRTASCIEVDLSCISSIQCLNSQIVQH
ncbi:spore coat protein [Bacillus timonensis]|nr:spore coat protein [Bacillus timonensis]